MTDQPSPVATSGLNLFGTALPSYTVTATANTGGTITPETQSITEGAVGTLTIAPNTGYTVVRVTGCGGKRSGTTYTTAAITEDCTVNATFKANVLRKYPLTVAKTGTGSGTFDGWSPSPCAASFTMPAKALVCTAKFTITPPQDHIVTAIISTGGTVTPSPQTIHHGATTIFAVIANAGYTIGTVTGCGGTLSGNVYTTGVITVDCTVNATFALIPPTTYTLTVTQIGSVVQAHLQWGLRSISRQRQRVVRPLMVGVPVRVRVAS